MEIGFVNSERSTHFDSQSNQEEDSVNLQTMSIQEIRNFDLQELQAQSIQLQHLQLYFNNWLATQKFIMEKGSTICLALDVLIILKFNLEQVLMAPIEKKVHYLKVFVNFVIANLSQQSMMTNQWPGKLCENYCKTYILEYMEILKDNQKERTSEQRCEEQVKKSIEVNINALEKLIGRFHNRLNDRNECLSKLFNYTLKHKTKNILASKCVQQNKISQRSQQWKEIQSLINSKRYHILRQRFLIRQTTNITDDKRQNIERFKKQVPDYRAGQQLPNKNNLQELKPLRMPNQLDSTAWNQLRAQYSRIIQKILRNYQLEKEKIIKQEKQISQMKKKLTKMEEQIDINVTKREKQIDENVTKREQQVFKMKKNVTKREEQICEMKKNVTKREEQNCEMTEKQKEQLCEMKRKEEEKICEMKRHLKQKELGFKKNKINQQQKSKSIFNKKQSKLQNGQSRISLRGAWRAVCCCCPHIFNVQPEVKNDNIEFNQNPKKQIKSMMREQINMQSYKRNQQIGKQQKKSGNIQGISKREVKLVDIDDDNKKEEDDGNHNDRITNSFLFEGQQNSKIGLT